MGTRPQKTNMQGHAKIASYIHCILAENDNRGAVDVDDDGADAPHDAAHIDHRLHHATYRQTGTEETQSISDAKLS